LFLIDEILRNKYNKSLANIPKMLQLIILWNVHCPNPLIVEQHDWNQDDFVSIINEHVPNLTTKQTIVYQEIITSMNEHSFLDEPGGLGKTYVYNTIVAKLSKRREVHNMCSII